MISRRQFLGTALFLLGTGILSWFKISFLVGSHAASFSLAHCLTPLIGITLGGLGATLLFLSRTVFYLFTATATSNIVLACHLPSLAAAFYLSVLHTTQYTITLRKKLLLTVIPVACMAIFCCHTVGAQAWTYSLFWLIPVAALITPHTNIFVHMLGSTFTAHAVGSVLWLYCVPGMTAEMWLGLIPVVVVERLLFAAGMYVSYYVITKLALTNILQPIRLFSSKKV